MGAWKACGPAVSPFLECWLQGLVGRSGMVSMGSILLVVFVDEVVGGGFDEAVIDNKCCIEFNKYSNI